MEITSMLLLRYIAKRLFWGLIVLVFISFFSFLIIQLPPGDFLTSYLERLEKAGMSLDVRPPLDTYKPGDPDDFIK